MESTKGIRMGKETFFPVSSENSAFVMDWTVEKGGGVPSHLHIDMDETFVVTHGELTFKLKEGTVVRRPGEELVIPRGVVHAVRNSFQGQSSARVTYSPQANAGKMFTILGALNATKPGAFSNILKTVYVMQALGLREFSTPQPAVIGTILMSLVRVIGRLSGWNRLTEEYRHLAS